MENAALLTSRPASVDGIREAMGKVFTEEGRRRGLAFRPRPTDVIISPFAKSGTTWLQQIVHGLRTRGSMDFDEITAETPWIEKAYDIGWDLEGPQAAEPRAYKSHLSWHEIPKGGRYICSIRHPYDVLISLYRFFEGWWFEPRSINLETFTHEWFTDNPHQRGYWHHLVSWWDQRHSEDVLLLCFEEMKGDLPGTVRTVARFIGVELDEALFEIVVRQSSRAFMLANVERFDDHIIRAIAEKRAGLPVNGASAKVTSGASDAARYRLSSALKVELDAIWREMVESRFGFKEYGELRQALRELTPEIGAHRTEERDVPGAADGRGTRYPSRTPRSTYVEGTAGG